MTLTAHNRHDITQNQQSSDNAIANVRSPYLAAFIPFATCERTAAKRVSVGDRQNNQNQKGSNRGSRAPQRLTKSHAAKQTAPQKNKRRLWGSSTSKGRKDNALPQTTD